MPRQKFKEGLRTLMCDHLKPPDPYNQIVESQLRETEFYYVSQIGVIQCQSAMINALIERWRSETHTFHFPVGECVVTLEDVVVILGLPTNGLPVTGPTMSSFEALEAECLLAPRKTDCRGSFIKLTWFRGLKDCIVHVYQEPNHPPGKQALFQSEPLLMALCGTWPQTIWAKLHMMLSNLRKLIRPPATLLTKPCDN
ncbi:hypothetical protein Ahy_B10g105943 [Arachis hypogaea]|uniref:Aminotransferase-like plant mobile domain-containing protein n=1 Tax=Arachis hypogaea TaxID=3818 RepID=A0A444X9C8_ARAHY|nr:hypothetical protein Ahy_B10g105943 [Arachis hypogaea]